jgi:N-acyl-D-aspartate/D-glutamate deacylase
MFDLVIRNGRVLDGTGGPERTADVAVGGGRIVAVGPDLAGTGAAEVVEASGLVVTPGFVDIHTHYDGQVLWDDLLEPTSAHGVTTVVTGNCGVGFAPVAGESGRQRLLDLMAGVEDIPRSTLEEGVGWGWESFSDYLDVLAGLRWSVDVATQVPHGAVRALVRGHSDDREPGTAQEIARMVRLVGEAIEAGAFSVTTSRTLGHLSLDSTPVPGTYASYEELRALAEAVQRAGGSLMEFATSGLAVADDDAVVDGEIDRIGRIATETGLTTTFILLQCHNAPERWRREAEQSASWRARGASVVPLIAGRPFTSIWGWDVRHPFMARASYRNVARLSLPERLVELRRPAVRAAVLAEPDQFGGPEERRSVERVQRVLSASFPMVSSPDYEPEPERSIGAIAAARGVSAEEVAYDILLNDGAMLCNFVYNYADGDHAALHQQLLDRDAVVGLNDGGAHTALICDSTIPTYMLTHWARDRRRGPQLELPEVVRRFTSQPADLYGLTDRGRIEPGLRADLNVIDFGRLRLGVPVATADLPAGGVRMLQDATGYVLTTVAGSVTRRGGTDTGARPGRLVRRG